MADTMGAPLSASTSSPASSSPQGQPDPGARPQASPAVPDFKGTKHKVKVFDREVEVDYDELRRGYQLKQASHKALEEAAHARKQAEGLLTGLKARDRKAFATALGGEDALREFAESLLIDDLEERSLPPAEKRARAAEARAKELEAWKKQQEDAREQESQTAAEREAGASIDTDITDAFTDYGAKPTPYLVARVADEMAARIELGRPISAKQALQLVDRASTSEIREMPPEKLLEKLTPAHIEFIRKHLVDQVMTQQPRRVRAPEGAVTRTTKREPMTIEEAFKAKQQAYRR